MRASSTPAARQGGPSVWMVGQRLHHRKDGAVLQERKFASSEVIQQRPKGFGPHGDLRVQPPRAIGIELARPLVDDAGRVTAR